MKLGAVWGAINEKYQTREPSRIRGFLKGIRCLEHPRAIRGPIECNTTVPVCRIVGTLVSCSSAFRGERTRLSGRGRSFFPLEREDAQGRERMQSMGWHLCILFTPIGLIDLPSGGGRNHQEYFLIARNISGTHRVICRCSHSVS